MPSETENVLAAKNITLLYNEVESKFAEYRRFAGAGGMGAVIISPNSTNSFLQTLEAYNCDIVVVSLVQDYNQPGKKYSSLIPSRTGVIEYVVLADPPLGAYSLDSFNYQTATFKKGPNLLLFFAVLFVAFIFFIAIPDSPEEKPKTDRYGRRYR